MNLRDLCYLVAIADHSHFGRAAEACFVSQPALSMQIKKLEETLGVPLVERSNKSVFLTEVGKVITQQARLILDQVESMKETANQAKDPFSGTLHIGIIPTLAPYLLPHIIPGLSQRFPKLTFYLLEEITARLLIKLEQGKLDGALLALPLESEDWVMSPLFEEEFVLAISPHHSLAKRRKVTLSDLENEPLLLLEEGHCLRKQALAVCHQARATEIKSFQATSLETLRYMVSAKAGMTLMPQLACRPDEAICYRPFQAPKPVRTIAMIWRKSMVKRILLEDVVMQIKKLMAARKLVKVISMFLILLPVVAASVDNCHSNMPFFRYPD